MILTKFSKIAMLHVVLNRQNISKTILEKAFFFIVWRFYLLMVFVLINFKIGPSEVNIFFLEIGHIGYQKIENFMLVSKKQTCLSDKMPPKQLKLKNEKNGTWQNFKTVF